MVAKSGAILVIQIIFIGANQVTVVTPKIYDGV